MSSPFDTGFRVNQGVYVNCDLTSIFTCEPDIITSGNVGSTNRTHTYNFTLTNNRRNDTNYIVLATILYGSDGTSGTYNPYEGSTNAGNPLVFNRTSTGFSVRLYKYATGDNWSGAMMVFVVYPH